MVALCQHPMISNIKETEKKNATSHNTSAFNDCFGTVCGRFFHPKVIVYIFGLSPFTFVGKVDLRSFQSELQILCTSELAWLSFI